MKEKLPEGTSNVWMQIDDENKKDRVLEDGKLPKEIEDMLKQTAIRTILYQISANYREELEKLLGKDNIDENGQPKALSEDVIPIELYEFICKSIIGKIPSIEIEITDEETEEMEETEESVRDAINKLEEINDSEISFEDSDDE
jgi:hypothetical protein